MTQLTKAEIIQILDKEIKWCIDNPNEAFHAEYRKGFINGLIQAKYLITEASKEINKREKSKPSEAKLARMEKNDADRFGTWAFQSNDEDW